MGERSLAESTQLLRADYLRSRTDSGPEAEKNLQGSRLELSIKLSQATADVAGYERAIADYRESALAAVQRDYDLMKAKTAELKAQADHLRQQEESAKAAAIAYGAASPDQREQVLQAAELFQRTGGDIGQLPPEYRQLLLSNQVTREAAERAAIEAAKADERFRKFQEQFGKKDFETLRAERIKVEQEIRIKVELDEKQYLELHAKALKAIDEKIKDLIIKQAQIKEASAIQQAVGRAVGSQ